AGRPDGRAARPGAPRGGPAGGAARLGALGHARPGGPPPGPAVKARPGGWAPRGAGLARRWHPPRPTDPFRRSGCPRRRDRGLAGRRAPPTPATGRRTTAAVDPARLGTDHTRDSERTDRPPGPGACAARSEQPPWKEVRPMTIRTESRITIASSVREVWAYVCDVGRWPEWAPTVLECRVRGGAPLQPGSRVEQRAKGILWLTRGRSQEVTAVEAPRYVAFAGPMGSSAAGWGRELEPVDDRQTDAKMWIEVDLAGIMRAVPGRILKGRIQRVSDREMAAIKAAVEPATRGGAKS